MATQDKIPCQASQIQIDKDKMAQRVRKSIYIYIQAVYKPFQFNLTWHVLRVIACPPDAVAGRFGRERETERGIAEDAASERLRGRCSFDPRDNQ